MDEKVFELVEKANHFRARPENFGMTAPEYARRKGISVGFARRLLDDMVEAEMLEREEMIYSKGRTYVYFEKQTTKKPNR